MSNRKQYVKYNVNESGFKEIQTEVSQGSILGPLLFCIYINYLSTISNPLKFIMYGWPHCLISEEEVAAAIKGLKIGKAAGPTGVVSEMMKAAGGFGSR